MTSGLEAGAAVTLGCRASDGKVGQTYLIYFMDTPNSLQVSTRRSCLYRNHMRSKPLLYQEKYHHHLPSGSRVVYLIIF